MFVRIKRSKNSPKCAVQIVESCRIDGKVRQKIVKHMGTAMEGEELEALKALAEVTKRALEREGKLPLFDEAPSGKEVKASETSKALEVDLRHIVEERRLVKGIHDIYGKLYEELGFEKVIANPARNRRIQEALKQIVLARIAHPQSKRASARELGSSYGVTLDLKLIYRMMDRLDDQAIERLNRMVRAQTSALFDEKIDVVYFDATTLYFESFSEDEGEEALKRNGYSKDGKFNQPQVVLALMVTKEGLPIGYRAFRGDTFDGHTLFKVLEDIKEEYILDHVVYVADSGMFNAKTFEAFEALRDKGISYIVGARIKNMPQSLQRQILEQRNYTPLNEELRIATFDYRGKKLLVSHSRKREHKDRQERETGIARLKRKIEQSGSNAKSHLSHQGYRKYLRLSGDDKKACTLSLDEAKIEEDARWDGLKGILTNNLSLSDGELLEQYANLWQVEESFRITKHDLKIRPIYHWKPQRVKAHLAIAFMAYTLVRHLQYRVSHQYRKLSIDRIRTALLGVQESRLLDTQTQRRYALPSAVTVDAEKIYKLMGVKLQRKVYELER